MEMNKGYEYRGYIFNIGVELNTKAERHPGGKVWHTVTINDMGLGSFYKKEEIEDARLKMYLKMDVIYMINKYVDLQLDGGSEVEKMLSDLGYK